MNMIEYLNEKGKKKKVIKMKEKGIENDLNCEEQTIDDLIAKRLKIKEISEDKNNDISYKLNFDFKI